MLSRITELLSLKNFKVGVYNNSQSMSKPTVNSAIDVFTARLGEYKVVIDADIAEYSAQLVARTGEQFGQYSAESMRVFADVMARGGKRIRGALTMHAYEMFGGTDESVALQAARIMEMVQTYLLVVDDVYDRSGMRRGAPTAHVMLDQIHQAKHWRDGSAHFGESIAINSAIIASHTAMSEASRLNVSAETVVRALRILNDNLIITGEGQTNDIFNEVVETVDSSQVENVLIWKTAYYTFANPLQFGAVLAGASDEDLGELLEYSLAAGRTFQITDDVLGTFNDAQETGKSPMDDIKEGKRTLLSVYALQHAPKEDAYFLERMMGNPDITAHQFKRCKDIIFASGAYDYAQAEAAHSAEKAVLSVARNWSDIKSAIFLQGLVEYLLERKS